MSSITELLNTIRDFARPNYFQVKIYPFFEVESIDFQKIHLLAKSINIPSTDLGEISFTRAGVKIALPGDITPGDITITFLNDIDFEIRNFFIEWVFKINNILECRLSHLKEILKSKIEIYQLNHSTKKPTIKYNILNCFPKSISEIQLSHDNENQVEEFSVVFGYTYYTIEQF